MSGSPGRDMLGCITGRGQLAVRSSRAVGVGWWWGGGGECGQSAHPWQTFFTSDLVYGCCTSKLGIAL